MGRESFIINQILCLPPIKMNSLCSRIYFLKQVKFSNSFDFANNVRVAKYK